MANIEEKFIKALEEIRKTDKKRNFNQSIDLIINLKEFDVRRNAFNIFIQVPNKVKDKKIAGFFEKKSGVVDSITSTEFAKYKEKKDIKKLIKAYDFFVANAKLMPAIATAFGRVLGPVGKMPSPQLGILLNEEEKTIQAIVNKINSTARVKVKEPSIKVVIGKESLTNEQLAENAVVVYNKVLENLPRNKDNIRDVKIKLTMDKPVKVGI